MADSLTTLSLIESLCKALDAENVAYCHWKSTTALARSASGDTDLDLLIHRPDTSRFTEVLHRLGFKEAVALPARRLPGVQHYYGYDEDSGRFVHVHAHYQLIVGDDMTKNYRVPIERAFLESAVEESPFKIPSPEFEFILLVIRMILKHATWDAMLRLRGRLPASARSELEDLEGKIDPVTVSRLLEEHVPSLTQPLFDRCLLALRPGCPVWERMATAFALERALGGHGRRTPVVDLYLKQWRWARRVTSWLVSRRSPKKRLGAGGALIALVGGDGAGKSTAVTAVHRWLSQNFDTRTVHLGKPPESPFSLAVGVLLLLRRRWGAPPAAQAFPGYLWLLRRVCVARRRYRAYASARRFATNGGLVICDRYPIRGLRLMDGPQCVETLGGAPRNRLIDYLAQKEDQYYRRIMPPDVLLVLSVDPETAVRRKTDEVPATVRVRNREARTFDWARMRARVVDASPSSAEVAARLKSLIWSSL